MTDINNELFHGKAVAAKVEAFDKGIKQLEEKHKDFFKNTVSKYSPEGEDKPAEIGEFYTLQFNSYSASIGVENDLPPDIGEEIRELFKRSFE
ncbi:hypothetical protein HER32_14330 [Hymenobacter sp. BT18]|uniref:hypothetical protein n=1 Tax=Hymenobacter sp. BT18 TaxID=2835648 RepID=UPI00143EBDDB|nr:hypothetical protein [Hymenobacter sp. BT18]QIX62291.1 hypothetical protein HER32_14330 [Hymenobacter sp. BT18]